MSKGVTSKLSTIAVAVGCAIGLAQNAHAVLLLAGTVAGVNVCAADNNVGCTFGAIIPDTDPTLNVLSLGAAPVNINGILVSGSLHTATFGPPLNILNSSSLSVVNTTGATAAVNVAVGQTGFTPPVSTATTAGSGTWVNAAGSTLHLEWWNDPANAQGAETPDDLPGALLDTFDFTATLNPDAHSTTGGPFAISDPDPFSMTVAFAFDLVAGGSLINRGMSEIKPVGVVPEPGALLLLATALGLLGWRCRKSKG